MGTYSTKRFRLKTDGFSATLYEKSRDLFFRPREKKVADVDLREVWFTLGDIDGTSTAILNGANARKPVAVVSGYNTPYIGDRTLGELLQLFHKAGTPAERIRQNCKAENVYLNLDKG